MKETFRKHAPEPVLRMSKPVYHQFKRTQVNFRERVTAIADRWNVIGPDQIYSNEYFRKRQADPWRSDANHIGDILRKEFEPQNIIDFGCAIGAHLEPFHEHNIDIQGVEGAQKAIDYAVVPEEYITQHDLREPYNTESTYDLAISFEVAEHISKKYDGVFIDSITRSSDCVVITAAPPGQKGTHHVNLKPRSYWISKFRQRGFDYKSDKVDILRSNINVEETVWIPDNIFVFER